MSAGEKGSGLQSLSRRSSSATISISPVAMFLLMVSGVAQLHVSDDGDDELGAQRLGLVVDAGVRLGVEDNLSDAGAVAQVDKDKVAEIAAAD